MSRIALAAVLLIALGAAAEGCGLGAGGGGGGGVSITVTRDFGGRTVGDARAARSPGSETVMRFLQRKFRVATRYGGGFVQSIDGLSGGSRAGRPIDWFYYVNGIEASRGAAGTTVHAGDRIWWDLHQWRAAMSIPAVVGSFPEPFRSGSGGRRLPVTIGCGPGAGAACKEARRRLSAIGVPLSSALVGAPAGEQTLRLLVGVWSTLRLDPVAGLIERGPGRSGVYLSARDGGRGLVALDAAGRPARTLGHGDGVIAATRPPSQQPTWVVTGTDAAGVLAAARALDESDLHHRFALLVSRARRAGLPLAAGEGAR